MEICKYCGKEIKSKPALGAHYKSHERTLNLLKSIDKDYFIDYFNGHKDKDIKVKFNINHQHLRLLKNEFNLNSSHKTNYTHWNSEFKQYWKEIRSGENNPQYGKPSWNSGKSYKDDLRILSGTNHPMFGKTHNKNSRLLMSKNHSDVSGENNPMYGIHRYGKDNPNWGNSVEVRKYYYNNIYFDSSWELYYYIYLVDNNYNFKYHPGIKFKYIYNNIEHNYFPDFKVDDDLIEIKGDYFFDECGNFIDPYDNNNDKAKSKYECMMKNNIIILKGDDLKDVFFFVNNKYGKNYIKQFKVG